MVLTEMNNELKIDFFKIVPLALNTLNAPSFEVILKHLFSYDVRLHCHIFFNIIHVLKSYP